MISFSALTLPRRVLVAAGALAIGVGTNAIHRNILSGLLILITSIALAVWLGGELGKKTP